MKLQNVSVCISAVGFAASATLAASVIYMTRQPAETHAAPAAPTATAGASAVPTASAPVVAALRADEQVYADSLRGSYPTLAGVPAVELRDKGRALCAHLLDIDYVEGSSGEAGWANLGMIGTATRDDLGLAGGADWFAAFDLTAKYLCPEIAAVG